MRCNKCHREKELSDFSYKNQEKGVRKKICKQCHSLYRRQHYLQNKEKYIAKALKWNKEQGKILSQFLFNTLSQSQCVDCGEKDILVLEFDHISGKTLGISEMYKNRYSLVAVKNELEKCVVRCANCHRRKTAKDSRFWKLKLMEI
jgi:hypothetical protein